MSRLESIHPKTAPETAVPRESSTTDLLHLAAIIDSSDDAIVSKTLDGIVTSWNPGAVRVFGYEADEMIGQPISILIPEDRRDEEPAILAQVRAGKKIDHYETIRCRKDGRLIHVSVTVSPIKTPDGAIIGASKIARDITERVRSDEQLKQLNVELEKRVDARTAELRAANGELECFSYSVSHDLRAPLRAIDGFSRALLDDYSDKLDEQGRQFLERVRAATSRMSNLIDDLLNLSRLTRAELRVDEVNLSQLSREVLEELRQGDPGRNVEVIIAPDLVARGDKDLLRILLVNLLGNAWKFTAKTAKARIEVGRTTTDGQQIFFIRDNGAGFDMADAHKLYKPFERLHKTNEFEGTGIGLAIVQRIVYRHQGRIWAEGEVDRGATFYLTLPL